MKSYEWRFPWICLVLFLLVVLMSGFGFALMQSYICSLKMIRMMLKKSNWFVLSAQVAFKMSAGALT